MGNVVCKHLAQYPYNAPYKGIDGGIDPARCHARHKVEYYTAQKNREVGIVETMLCVVHGAKEKRFSKLVFGFLAFFGVPSQFFRIFFDFFGFLGILSVLYRFFPFLVDFFRFFRIFLDFKSEFCNRYQLNNFKVMKEVPFLIVPFDKFKGEIETQMKKANELFQLKFKSKEELDKGTSDLKSWIDETHKILSESFSKSNNEFEQEFLSSKTNSYNLGYQKDLRQLIDEHKDLIRVKNYFLQGNLRLISASDLIINHDKKDLFQRADFSTAQKLELILEKLYDLYDDNYYPILDIIRFNGLELKRMHEERELAKMLENLGYIEVSVSTCCRLTSQGAMYIEEKRMAYIENYDDIIQDQKIMSSRIDEIIEKLTSLGYGQEILFEEIEELKGMYGKMTKKNWGQLVKGKLFDLALGKVVENETISWIYEAMTNHKMRIL